MDQSNIHSAYEQESRVTHIFINTVVWRPKSRKETQSRRKEEDGRRIQTNAQTRRSRKQRTQRLTQIRRNLVSEDKGQLSTDMQEV